MRIRHLLAFGIEQKCFKSEPRTYLEPYLFRIKFLSLNFIDFELENDLENKPFWADIDDF